LVEGLVKARPTLCLGQAVQLHWQSHTLYASLLLLLLVLGVLVLTGGQTSCGVGPV